MVTVYGSENTPEYEAGRQLRNLITQEWPEVEHDNRHDVSIITNVKCYGQKVVDIDLVLFMRLWKPLATHITYEDGADKVFVQCLCIAFECKDHSISNVIFEGNRVKVRYPERIPDVSEQSFQQQVSLRKYLKSNKLHSPWVFNLIWLRSVLERDLPQIQHNIIGFDSDWKNIIQGYMNKKVADGMRLQRYMKSILVEISTHHTLLELALH